MSTTESASRPVQLNGSAPATVIKVRGLRKSHGRVEAVRGVDLTVSAGEIVAFLGPHGAGKTTTVEILAGHRQRDAGEVSALGFDPGADPRAFRERIGIVPQETAVEPVLTVLETVRLYSATSRSASPATPSCSSSTSPLPGSTPLPDAGRGS